MGGEGAADERGFLKKDDDQVPECMRLEPWRARACGSEVVLSDGECMTGVPQRAQLTPECDPGIIACSEVVELSIRNALVLIGSTVSWPV